MVASAAPSPFILPPDRVGAFIQALSEPTLTLENIASDFGTTVGALCLYLTSPDCLALIADVELAMAARIRVAAQALLPDVIETLSYVIRQYGAEERRILTDTSTQRLKLLEHKRANARRAANLIVRLAHFSPQPLRDSTPRPAPAHAPARETSPPDPADARAPSAQPANPAADGTSSGAAPPSAPAPRAPAHRDDSPAAPTAVASSTQSLPAPHAAPNRVSPAHHAAPRVNSS